MHGLIAKITAQEGERDALIDILLAGTQNMPGCISYVIARDQADDAVIWITEVWENKQAHVASHSLPQVQDSVAKGRPLIAQMAMTAVTEPANK
ncbi:putative quinol monooxygenase [Kordiimonas aquimaris]|uniref:putative quinol monooxygenase n=1 Tax=Kordiimonas aquimaris TaxID=707591 RepID=UPI0021CF56AE|nr:putative quinol monooxygenase [Kordiimonas aquimaris]